MTCTEVEGVSGYVGNFTVRLKRRARFVDENECTACGDCAEVCPVVVPDEFNLGLSSRRAVYQPFPQAVPAAYTINMDECLGATPIACGRCLEACEKGCIDFDMRDETLTVEVGVIVVATGMSPFDPSGLEEYGYGRYPDVVTSLEFERLISSGGPTKGELLRPSDLRRPRSVAFIQCVGSRTCREGAEYCSNICCMNTVKDTLLIADHYPGTEVTVFYQDIRAFGKGFESLFARSRREGTRYVPGLPGMVERNPETGGLVIWVENRRSGRIESYEVEMVILSIGLVPNRENDSLRRLLNLSVTSDGLLMEAHPKLRPVDAPGKGVFMAGCVEAPKDVKDSVTQGSAAAARAERMLAKGAVKIEAVTGLVSVADCRACGRCAPVCPYGAIEWEKGKTPTLTEAMCAGCGACSAECPFDAISMRHFTDEQLTAQIDAALATEPEKKVVTFACNWCSYAGADTCGINRFQYPSSVRLIRTMCSGRVDPELVLYAFEKGAPVVLVSGCHFADCHYINANRHTFRRMQNLWREMEKLGIRPERLRLEWISAAEGARFAEVMHEMEKTRVTVTDEERRHAMRVLADRRAKREARLRRGQVSREAKTEV